MFTEYLSNMIIKGGVAPVFDDPAQYGLAPEDVEFVSSDGVTLRGWLFRGSGTGIIVQSHFGVQCSRSGYTPEGKGWMPLWSQDIHFLKHIRALVDAGYSVLAYDTRNHGNSDTSNDNWVSWGPTERLDVLAAVRFVASHPDYKDSPIGLLSFCMGLASTTYAYGEEDGLGTISNIKALVGVQPLLYTDFMKSMKMPDFVNNWVNAKNSERTGVDLVNASFMPHVSKISVPTLLVQNKNDPFPDMANVDAYFEALTVEKERLDLDLEPQRAAAYAWVTESPDFLITFFDAHLRTA
ncbi:MAG: alpha/beta hydrolase [Myxococcota bacterium]